MVLNFKKKYFFFNSRKKYFFQFKNLYYLIIDGLEFQKKRHTCAMNRAKFG
jgi:hypothetical protein